MSIEDHRIDLIRQRRWELQSTLDRVTEEMLDTCSCLPLYDYLEIKFHNLRREIQEIDELLARVGRPI